MGKEWETDSETAARCLINNPVNEFWSSFNGEEELKKNIMDSGGSCFDVHASGHGFDCCLLVWVRKGRVEC